MKKIFFALFIALAIFGCKKKTSDDPATASFRFNNGTNGQLAIAVNGQEAVSLSGGKASECDFASVDPSVAEVMNIDGVYYIVAKAEGTTVISATKKSDATQIALLEVTVTGPLNLIKFSQIYWMQASEDWHDVSTALIRKRMYRGVELPDGGDAQLTRDDSHIGDTADIASWIDEVKAGKWYFLYTDQDGDSIGIFTDSVKCRRSWLMSSEVYFNGDDELTVSGDEGAIFEFSDFYSYDIKYSYCLGNRYFCDDVTAEGRQYAKTGQSKTPYPGFIQVGHFNEKNYLDYFTAALSGGSPDKKDYPFYGNYDSFFKMLCNAVEEETGESYMYMLDLGYPKVGVAEEDGMNLYIGSDEATGWFKAEYHYIEATLFTSYGYYGLSTEVNENGELIFTDPLQMGAMADFVYEGGDVPMDAPSRIKGAKRHTSEMPVLTKTLDKQMSVTNTIAATLRMVLSSTK